VREVTGYDNVEFREPRYEVKHAIPDYKKSIEKLDFKQATSLEDGIKEMWNWAKEQPMRSQYKWENYEINKGIYSYWK
jgi:UDP-glucose 4-epimerase